MVQSERAGVTCVLYLKLKFRADRESCDCRSKDKAYGQLSVASVVAMKAGHHERTTFESVLHCRCAWLALFVA